MFLAEPAGKANQRSSLLSKFGNLDRAEQRLRSARRGEVWGPEWFQILRDL